MIIRGYDADEVLYKTSKELLDAPTYSPRGMETKELIKPQLVIENPVKGIITNPGRKLSMKYLKAEMDWYNSQDRSVEEIGKYASMWNRIADADGNVNSNYGEIIWGQELENYDGNQFQWVVNQLIADKDSRQAIINFNQPKHKSDTKDFVCTVATQYLIRNNRLISTTDMRSNDLVYGFSYDFPFFAHVQNAVVHALQSTYPDLKIGENIHTSTSLHAYKKHFGMLENIVSEYEKAPITSQSIEF